MPKHKDVSVERNGNVFIIHRRADTINDGFQRKSSFATELRQDPCMQENYDSIPLHIKAHRYIVAANIAGNYYDHARKMRICMQGIKHYEDELMSLKGNNLALRDELNARADLHELISELYMIFGNREKAKRHMDLSAQAARGMVPDY